MLGTHIMTFYFVLMVCPHTGRKYNIGDFKSLREAVEYASKVEHETEIRECKLSDKEQRTQTLTERVISERLTEEA
jgi:hypothetical protein